jgi:hypothetical protein
LVDRQAFCHHPFRVSFEGIVPPEARAGNFEPGCLLIGSSNAAFFVRTHHPLSMIHELDGLWLHGGWSRRDIGTTFCTISAFSVMMTMYLLFYSLLM